jgi:hypothetical protein
MLAFLTFSNPNAPHGPLLSSDRLKKPIGDATSCVRYRCNMTAKMIQPGRSIKIARSLLNSIRTLILKKSEAYKTRFSNMRPT